MRTPRNDAENVELLAWIEHAINLQKMLKRLQWSGFNRCPLCLRYRVDEHADECELAAILTVDLNTVDFT